MVENLNGRPRGIWYVLLHRRMHYSWRDQIIHWGFETSVILLGLMFLDIVAPTILWPMRYWIGIIYLAFQLAEIVARDALDMTEVMKDHIFSFIPAIVALILVVIHWWSGYRLLTSQGIATIGCWLVVAWIDFAFGLAISMRILSTPYRREETPAAH